MYIVVLLSMSTIVFCLRFFCFSFFTFSDFSSVSLGGIWVHLQLTLVCVAEGEVYFQVAVFLKWNGHYPHWVFCQISCIFIFRSMFLFLSLLPGFLQSKLALFHLSFKFGKIRITRVQYHFIRVVILLHTLNSYFDKHF